MNNTEQPAAVSRQVARRTLFKQNFTRMGPTDKHTTRQRLGFNADGEYFFSPRVTLHETRKARLNMARAFAAGAWKKRAN